jgi:hypothetical protein
LPQLECANWCHSIAAGVVVASEPGTSADRCQHRTGSADWQCLCAALQEDRRATREGHMTLGDLTPRCSTARGGGDPIPVTARCGATVAPRGADHGLRGPREEPGFVGCGIDASGDQLPCSCVSHPGEPLCSGVAHPRELLRVSEAAQVRCNEDRLEVRQPLPRPARSLARSSRLTVR